MRGFDGQLWWRQRTSAGWWAWQSFGGGIVGKPAVVSTTSGVYVFVRGLDNALWWQRYDGTRLVGLAIVRGSDHRGPGSGHERVRDLRVRPRAGTTRCTGSGSANGWSGWRGGGGNLCVGAGGDGRQHRLPRVRQRRRPPVVAAHQRRALRAAGRGSVGSLLGEPAAAADSSGVSVFVRGVDSALYRRRLSGGNWRRLAEPRRVPARTPTAVGAGNTIHVFAQGVDSCRVPPTGHRRRSARAGRRSVDG